MHDNFRSTILLCPKNTGPKAQDHFLCFALFELHRQNQWYKWGLIWPDIYPPNLAETWHQWYSQMKQSSSIAYVNVRLSRSSLLGIPAWVLCSPGMSPNWLVLPNRACTSSDWSVSVQTLPAFRSQMAHTPSIAARQNTGRFSTLLESYILVLPLHTKVYIVLFTWFCSTSTHNSVSLCCFRATF